jgi:hypothetical protein
MPDSPWTNPTKADGDAYEARHANGQPPEGFHRLNRDFSETDYQNGARIVRETDTYADWTAQPAPDAVRDSCDWCNQHRHESSAAIGAAGQQHASPGYWRQRAGLIYRNARIQGTELRRYRSIGYKPDGTQLYDLSYWQRRTVDHVKDGLEWIVDTQDKDCLGGNPFTDYASLFGPDPREQRTRQTA